MKQDHLRQTWIRDTVSAAIASDLVLVNGKNFDDDQIFHHSDYSASLLLNEANFPMAGLISGHDI